MRVTKAGKPPRASRPRGLDAGGVGDVAEASGEDRAGVVDIEFAVPGHDVQGHFGGDEDAKGGVRCGAVGGGRIGSAVRS